MSAPKPSTVLLILALVAVVVLYVVGVSSRRSDSGTAVDKGSLQQRFLGKPRPVAAADMKGDLCQHAVPAGRSCAVEVSGSGSLVRSLPVSTTDAVTVTLEPKGQRAVPVQLKRLGTSQHVDLQVGSRGATVEVTCLTPVNPMVGCQVHVG